MPTMRDVARRAGVSVSTVSFVVNGTKEVTPVTRRRVEKAMSDLGFRRNVLARALASNQTKILALVVPAVEHHLKPTTLDVMTSAAVEAAAQGFNLALWPVSDSGVELDDYVASGLVDGLLLMEVQFDDPRVTRLKGLGKPFTLIGRTEDPGDMHWVDMDFEGSVVEATDHLTSAGHRNLALVIGHAEDGGLLGYGPLMRVEQTFRTVMERQGHQAHIVTCDYGAAAGRRAARRLLEEDPSITGILVMNEEAAFGLVQGIVDIGRTVPEDVSVVSLATTTRTAALAEPSLTAMIAPGRLLGQLAVTSLIGQTRGESEPTHALVPCRLEVGASTASAPNRPGALPNPEGNEDIDHEVH